MQVLMEWMDRRTAIGMCVTKADGKRHAIRVEHNVEIGVAFEALESVLKYETGKTTDRTAGSGQGNQGVGDSEHPTEAGPRQ